MAQVTSVYYGTSKDRYFSSGADLQPFLRSGAASYAGFNLKLPAAFYRTARAVHPEPTVADAFARLKYFARGMLSPRLTAEWFAILASPALGTLVKHHPHILSKLQRPYLHRRLTQSRRLKALKNHYEFVNQCLGEKVRREIFSPRGFVLAELPVLPGGDFAIRLFYSSQFEKEGELSVGLFSEPEQRVLFTLTFCVNRFDPAGTEIFVGGLQGHQFENQREVVVGLTRSLHGLRPKALLVFVLQRLAQLWGCSGIIAVGDAEHIYRHILKRKTLHAAYDDFWLESLGLPLPGGNFALPALPQSRNISELPSGKRPVYRRRYAMLAQLGEQIRDRLAGTRLQGVPPPDLEMETACETM